MDLGDSPFLQSIDASRLTAIVRQSSRRDTLQVRDWRVQQLGGGAGNPVSAGLYRVEGIGQDRGDQVPWSVILKVLQSPANTGWTDMGEGGDQAHWNYWKRELFVYQSDLHQTLPEGMAAPHCYGVAELPGDIAWLWLEDITDSLGGAWSLERYALAARHLGRFNGLYSTSRPVPDYPWLGMNLIQQWRAAFQPHWQSLPWEHPLVRARYPEPEENSFRRLLMDGERFQAKLNRLPRTVCHGDTYPTNFMSRRLTGGREQTVALDWALVGVGPLGDDLGQFAFGAQFNLGEAGREHAVEALFESYMDGLRDGGCRVDPRLVRFGFAASAALRVGLFQVYLLHEALKQGGAAATETAGRTAASYSFEMAMADAAYELL